MTNSIRTVSLIGAGNVAHHLARAMVQNTIQVNQIYNRTLSKAQKIGEANKIRYTDKISELERSDLFIICTSDDVIAELSLHIPFDDVIVVHTSGSMPMNTLRGNYEKGVFYPLQTFSKGKTISYDDIPFFIEAESGDNANQLKSLAERISNKVKIVDSEQRAKMHLAAVWTCNFVNHLYYIGQNLAEKSDLSFDYLKPLIEETALKINELDPKSAQTGPAKRNDQGVIEKHIELLDNDLELQNIYKLLTESIKKTYQ